MTAAARKASERARRKERGEVALSGWLSASDHAALTQMARDSGMTQAQVVSRLIGMRAAVLSIRPIQTWEAAQRDADCIRHSDLTAAIGLGK